MTGGRTRSVLGPVVGLGVLVITIWTSLGVALGMPGESSVDLAAWQNSNYAPDVGSFKPVSKDLLQELLGYTPGTAGAAVAGNAFPGWASLQPSQAKDSSLQTPGPGDTPGPSAAPILTLSMSASPTQVHPGNDIVYTLHVANVGLADAERVEIDSYVPEGTTLVGGDQCGGQPVSVSPNVCVDVGGVVAPAPGGVWSTKIASIPARESRDMSFKVRVSPQTAPGTKISNYGTVSALNAPEIVTSNVVVVTVD